MLFTATRVSLSGGCLHLEKEGGITLTSNSVSTKKCVPVHVSVTYKRRLVGGTGTLVTASVQPLSFPSYMVPCTFEQLPQTWHDTNRESQILGGILQGRTSMGAARL